MQSDEPLRPLTVRIFFVIAKWPNALSYFLQATVIIIKGRVWVLEEGVVPCVIYQFVFCSLSVTIYGVAFFLVYGSSFYYKNSLEFLQ